MRTTALGLITALLTLGLGMGCGGDGDGEGSPEQTGQTCEVVDDCYPDVEDHEMLSGEVLCLERVRDGYCTHLCESDTDCCALEGECETDFPQVCAPFESTGQQMCFLSCEPEVLPADTDDWTFCQEEAGKDFICRSTGGGAMNRKVCVPGDCGVGAGCGGDEDCDPDLECVGAFDGGFCTVRDCAADADCPEGSVCVARDGGFDYCAPTCDSDAQCSFCRDPDHVATCTSDVTLVEATGVSVCVPPGA